MSTNSMCSFCEKKSPKLKACSKCHLTPYCSKECQRKDWKRHKLWCEGIQKSFSSREASHQELDATNIERQISSPGANSGGPHEAKGKKSHGNHNGPASQERRACNWCQKVCEEYQRCSRCKTTLYCSPVCQRKDWLDGHQKDCKPLVPQSTSAPPLKQKDKAAGEHRDQANATEENPQGQVSYVCEWCQKYIDLPLRCSGCTSVTYCSEECKMKDWESEHKIKCERNRKPKGVKQTSPSKPPEAVTSTDPAVPHGAEGMSTFCSWCKTFLDNPMKCTGCRKVAYCSKECQKKAWAKDHHMVCKGKTQPGEKTAELSAASTKDREKEGATAVAASDVPDCEICHLCKKRGDGMKKCARCKTVLYCSKTCQRMDWPQHKLECVTVDGVIKTKEFQKAEVESRRAAEAAGGPRMTYADLLAQMMGFGPAFEPSFNAGPRMGWSEAKRIAATKFLGYNIIDSLDELPRESLWLTPVTQNRVLLVNISGLHPYQTRHAIYIKDVNKEETFVMFYLDFDRPYPYFSWSQLTPGNYICIENAVFHNFMDGTTGIRVDEASDVRII
ncbi:uncharacterized protein [Haliotis cracherodii]|uniref:uncharacterized protein n=1 Tax=Haliotis cracherodii TaxID=6455 RepID=UPI0039ECF094